MKKLQAIRGMNDILPNQTPVWQYLEDTVKHVLAAHGYAEIRMPILEPTQLFKRSIGEVTDIVEKEMYTFEDRNGDSLTLRPEGTASCVRAAQQHSLLHDQLQRFWYTGPMFRHERPQKGRYRQFYQIGVETFGMQGPDIDAELILMSAHLWQALGIDQAVTLELNSLGGSAERALYKNALVEYLEERKDQLDEDSQRRLLSNPLRILDSKNPNTQTVLEDAPTLSDFISEEDKAHFETIKLLLDRANVPYRINPKLVRGLDYYGKTVFEWVTDALGAQGTVCAGGRYDGLVEQLGGKPTPAVGFAMGVERLLLLMEACDAIPSSVHQVIDVYLITKGEEAQQFGLLFGLELRKALPKLRLVTHCGGGSLKSQMKKADKSGALLALIIAENEVNSGTVTLKSLRQLEEDQGHVQQQEIQQDQVIDELKLRLSL